MCVAVACFPALPPCELCSCAARCDMLWTAQIPPPSKIGSFSSPPKLYDRELCVSARAARESRALSAGGAALGGRGVHFGERDLERPRVLLSAVQVCVRRCLCGIVMLSSCALSEGVPGVRSFTSKE